MIIQAAYPSLPKVLQLPAHPPSWGTRVLPACGASKTFRPHSFQAFSISSLVFLIPFSCHWLIHAFRIFIGSFVLSPHTFPTFFPTLQPTMRIYNYCTWVTTLIPFSKKKIILTHLDTIQLTMRIKQGITSKILLTLVTSQGFEGIKTVLVGTNK